MDYWPTAFLHVLFPILLICSVCWSQFTTICNNNTEFTLYASENKSYIESYNYPGDYDDSYGDCKINILTNESYINVKIEVYVRRNSGNPLKILNGGSEFITTKTLKINKTYTSEKSRLYMTHWSFGSTNDAFRISYQSEEKDYTEGEDDNNNWMWGIIGVVVFIVFCSICCSKRGGQNRRPAPHNPQPQPPPSTNQNSTGTTNLAQAQDTGSNVEMATENSTSQDAVINRDDPPPYEEAVHFPKVDKSGIVDMQVQPAPPPYTHDRYTIIEQSTMGNSQLRSIGSHYQTTVANPYALNFESNRMTPNSNYPEIAEETLYSSEVSGRQVSGITNRNFQN